MGVTLVTYRGYEKLSERFRRELELLPKPLQLLVEDLSEGQQVIPGFSNNLQIGPIRWEHNEPRIFSTATTTS